MIIKVTKYLLILIILLSSTGYFIFHKNHNLTVIHSHKNYNEVKVHRDSDGIVFIESQKKVDAIFGMGFAHAQDRLFQMNIHRKIPQGRMAELFGVQLVETDQVLRTFGLARLAKEMEKTLSDEERTYLQAYADGVNTFVEQQYTLPMEFLLTGVKFEKWEIYDTLCFIKLLNFMLSLDWRSEMIRTDLQQHYGRDIADYIIPNMGKYMINDVTIMNEDDLKQMNLYEKFDYQKIVKDEPNEKNITITKENMDKIIQMKMPSYLHDLYLSVGGSNAWVVSGQHTKSGKPLLSNDPHLEVRIPSIWHLSHLSYFDEKGEKQIRSGGAMAGGGGVYFSGKSDYFAFGLTTLCADTVDLYYETIKDNQYLYDEKWYDLITINEEIKVKGQAESINYQVKLTNKGPLLEPEAFKNLDKVVSWAWAGDSGRDTTYLGVIQLMDAKSVEDINEGFSKITGPPQAVVYATVDGDIGFYGTGRIPEKNTILNKGYILDGSKKINNWKRYIPKSEQPRLINPKKGYIVVANNKIGTDDMKNFYTYNMMTTNRAHRIEELILQKIKSGKKLTQKDMMEIQFDHVDKQAQKQAPNMVKIFQKYQDTYYKETNISQKIKQKVEKSLEILSQWDGNMDKKLIAPALYQVWFYFLKNTYLEKSHPNQELKDIIIHCPMGEFRYFVFNELERYLKKNENLNSEWCENKLYSSEVLKQKFCVFNVVHSLIQTIEFLQLNWGDDFNGWEYGVIHQHIYKHIPFSDVPILSTLYSRKFPHSGNENTVNPSASKYVGGKQPKDLFNGSVSGNLKTVFDLSSSNDDYWIIDTGNDESIFSPYYDNFIDLYQNGQYLKLNRNLQDYKNTQTLTNRQKQKDEV